MLALYVIIVGSLALLLITPWFAFVCLSLEPHRLRRGRPRAGVLPQHEGSKTKNVQLLSGG